MVNSTREDGKVQDRRSCHPPLWIVPKVSENASLIQFRCASITKRSIALFYTHFALFLNLLFPILSLSHTHTLMHIVRREPEKSFKKNHPLDEESIAIRWLFCDFAPPAQFVREKLRPKTAKRSVRPRIRTFSHTHTHSHVGSAANPARRRKTIIIGGESENAKREKRRRSPCT